jgi:uncharacterized protein YukE
MTAQDRFQVEPDQIRGHATTVGSLSDQLSAIAASLPGGLAEQALGTFTQFLASGLQGAMGHTADAIAHASSSVDEMSTGLRRTADDYQRADDQSATRLSKEYA